MANKRPKKTSLDTSKPLLATLVILAVFCISITSWWLLQSDIETSPAQEVPEQLPTQEERLKTMFDEAAVYAQKYSDNFTTGRHTQVLEVREAKGQPLLSPQGEGTSLQVEIKQEIRSANKIKRLTSEVYSDFKQYLADRHYRVSRKEREEHGVTSVIMEEASTVCEIEDTGREVYLTCATLSKLRELAQELRPFIFAYREANAKVDISKLSFSGPEIKNSPIKGYKYATVGIGEGFAGAGALFYQVDDQWQYLRSFQDSIACSEFEKERDIAKALVGYPCYDEAEPAPNHTRTVRAPQ
jgi:hypothetical protein